MTDFPHHPQREGPIPKCPGPHLASHLCCCLLPSHQWQKQPETPSESVPAALPAPLQGMGMSEAAGTLWVKWHGMAWHGIPRCAGSCGALVSPRWPAQDQSSRAGFLQSQMLLPLPLGKDKQSLGPKFLQPFIQSESGDATKPPLTLLAPIDCDGHHSSRLCSPWGTFQLLQL